MAALSGCGNGSGAEIGPPTPSDVTQELKSSAPRVVAPVVDAKTAGLEEQEFGFSFLQQLDAHQNVAFSPYSLSTAFAMVTDAADGKTLDEIEQTLKFKSRGEAFHAAEDALEQGLAGRNREAIDSASLKVEAQVLAQSNDVWIRNDAPPQSSYLDTLARYYGAGVHAADFENRPDFARLAINDKVAEDTHELITDLIPEKAITDQTVLVLTNALYFKAPWQQPMAKPVPGDFHALDGSTKTAEMLESEQTTSYYEGDRFVATSLPYYGGELEMTLIVPDAGAYDDVRASLSSDVLSKIVSERGQQLLDIKLPKFDLKSQVDAKKTLNALGMLTPFDENAAQFPKLISGDFTQVWISDVLHQATVSIDEKGTEASAATAVIINGDTAYEPPPQPKAVTIDRPFLFVIRDNPTGAVLFVGQVVDP